MRDATDPDGRLFPIADAPTHPAMPLGRGGRPVPLKTVRNWIGAGKLRTAVINGRRYTCTRWIEEMAAAPAPAGDAPAGRTITQRQKAHERAAAALAADGL